MINKPQVNNDLYHLLGERWYTAQNDPVALLRKEAQFRNPKVHETLVKEYGPRRLRILDVGCGAGFLTNYLSQMGHEVVGVDISKESLEVATQYDKNKSVRYLVGDAHALPFESGQFDAVCLLDFLEHTEEPLKAIQEAARVLKDSGLLFFHTFNRNFLSWLIVIKGMEWFVANTPKHLHVLRLFIKPQELEELLNQSKLHLIEMYGSRPKLNRAFWKLIQTGTVPNDFEFTKTSSLWMGYTGFARRGQTPF
jgi:2-polyprenyl-6-hydroxyphenyl methylase/3-demethylubiquinone-9 3-methyltransferase